MLKKIFLQDINNYKYWIIAAIIIKAVFFSFMLSQGAQYRVPGAIYLGKGDSFSYIDPIDNLIENKGYFPDHRMPGYGAIYFLFRLISSKIPALNLLVMLQLILSAASVYFLALTARDIFKSDTLFYASFYAYLFSTYTSIFDASILTESLATSSLIFSLFYFVKAAGRFTYTSLFLSGLFMAWCVFLKAVCLPLLGLFLFMLLIFCARDYKFVFSKTLKAALSFLIVFLVIEGAWIVRNHKVYGRIIPLQKSIDYSHSREDALKTNLFDFVTSWGGDITWWNPKAEINWFEYIDNNENIRSQIKDIRIPSYIYTSEFSHAGLLLTKDYMSFSKDEALPKDEQDRFRRLATERLKAHRLSIKRERPFVYYVYAPLKSFMKFFFHSGTYNLFNKVYTELNIIELLFKLSMSLVYVFVVICGLSGIITLVLKNYAINNKLLIAFIPLYFSTVYPFLFRYYEYRYSVPAYPFMLVCALYFFCEVYNVVLKHRKKVNI